METANKKNGINDYVGGTSSNPYLMILVGTWNYF